MMWTKENVIDLYAYLEARADRDSRFEAGRHGRMQERESRARLYGYRSGNVTVLPRRAARTRPDGDDAA